jgi:hypothetical protein
VPDATGLIDLAEMTKSGSKYGAGKIRTRDEENPLPEQSCRGPVLAGWRRRLLAHGHSSTGRIEWLTPREIPYDSALRNSAGNAANAFWKLV